MKPLVEGLEPKYPNVEFRRLNVDGSDAAASALADKLGVQYVPTFVYVSKNGVSSGLQVGEQTAAQLEANIQQLR